MTSPFDNDYGTDDSDVGLDAESEKYTKKNDEWLKMTKGQTIRAYFVYFHSIDQNTVARARAAAKAKGEALSPVQVRSFGRRSVEERASSLSKTVDQLTVVDRLDLTEAKFKQMMGHYQQGIGFVLSRLGKDGPEADAVWKKLTEPKQYFTTLLLLYPTNQKGDIGESEKARLATDWRLIPWRFGKPQFERIWKLNAGLRENGLSLATQDLKFECKDAQYQNIDVTFAGAAIWQKSEKFRGVVLSRAVEMYDKLVPFREMSTDVLRSKLGIGGPAVSDVSPGSDFTDMLEGV
jgi:hypothetical protein